jgi:branched-chain amino acid transport system substrate-binding protein
LGRRGGVAFAALIAALAAAGCGGGGASAGATVSVYLSAPMRGSEAPRGRKLCAEAKHALAAAGGRAGDLHVRLSCLDASGPAGAWTLAQVGADARRAVQDSTTVAYIAEPEPRARLQSRPILQQAGIADVVANSGAAPMHRILHAVAEAGTESPRDSVREALP